MCPQAIRREFLVFPWLCKAMGHLGLRIMVQTEAVHVTHTNVCVCVYGRVCSKCVCAGLTAGHYLNG